MASLRPADARTEAMGFHTTHWTLVLAASAGHGAEMRQALASLCATYWHPLYAFVRRQGANPQEAEDLTQAFFCHFLERNALAAVQPGAGKFRSFLLACFKHFLAHQRARDQAQRRGGGWTVISLDDGEAETRYALGPVDHMSPDLLFERKWALATLERALAALRREYASGTRCLQFEELEGFLPGGRGCVSREELAARRGVSAGAIDVAIHRMRQRFGVLLREQVAQTVSSEAEVEDELGHLISVLGA